MSYRNYHYSYTKLNKAAGRSRKVQTK